MIAHHLGLELLDRLVRNRVVALDMRVGSGVIRDIGHFSSYTRDVSEGRRAARRFSVERDFRGKQLVDLLSGQRFLLDELLGEGVELFLVALEDPDGALVRCREELLDL